MFSVFASLFINNLMTLSLKSTVSKPYLCLTPLLSYSSGSSCKNIRRHHRQWSCAVSGECCDRHGNDWEWGCISGGTWGVPEWNGEAEEVLPSGTEWNHLRTPMLQYHGNTDLHETLLQGQWWEVLDIFRGKWEWTCQITTIDGFN